MKAYWVVRGNILNQGEYSKYIDLAGPIVHKHNGNFLVRGGQQIEDEGVGFDRTVLIEFSSSAEALSCYKSNEYQDALNYVNNSAKRLVTLVEGID